MSAIETRRQGPQLIVPALILRPLPDADLTNVPGRALIDTGSTITGISSPSIAASLDLTARGKRPLGSVHGEGQTERYLFRVGFDIASVDGAEPIFPYVFDAVIGFELKGTASFDILLGMDILGQCDLTMLRSGIFKLAFG